MMQNKYTNSNAYIVIVNVSSNHRLTKYTAFKLKLETIDKWNGSHLYDLHKLPVLTVYIFM